MVLQTLTQAAAPFRCGPPLRAPLWFTAPSSAMGRAADALLAVLLALVAAGSQRAHVRAPPPRSKPTAAAESAGLSLSSPRCDDNATASFAVRLGRPDTQKTSCPCFSPRLRSQRLP